jgi:hypothetical protein
VYNISMVVKYLIFFFFTLLQQIEKCLKKSEFVNILKLVCLQLSFFEFACINAWYLIGLCSHDCTQLHEYDDAIPVYII